MNDNEFWVRTWQCVTVFVCFTTLLGSISCQTTNLFIVQAIEAGASPMEASCALASANQTDTLCMTTLTRKP
jgi:hypothetical protein